MSLRSAANQSALMSLISEVPRFEKPKPVYLPVAVGDWYATTRHKLTTKVIVVEVKHDTVKIKRDPNAKDSETVTRARFDKFYQPCKADE